MIGSYYTDNAAPCGACGSTCAEFNIAQDYRYRSVVSKRCWCCRREFNLGLLPILKGDDAKALSAWDRERADARQVQP